MTPRPTGPWLLALLFVLSLPAVTPRLYASDEVQYFAYLRSLWFDRDVSFENEYRYYYDRGIAKSEGFRETFLERRTETGRRINFATIGCALLWAPFYAAGDAVARAGSAGAHAWPVDGFSQPYVTAVAYGSAFYGFLAILLSVWMARRYLRSGVWPGLVVWLGTPLLFYMYIAPPMSHACSAFAVAVFVAAWLKVRERWTAGGLALLGALAALMAMVREQDAFFAIGPMLDFGRTWLTQPAAVLRPENSRGRLAAKALLGAAVAAIVYLPQALSYLALNGYVGPSRLVVRKMNWLSPHFGEVLFSPSHGFFVWTPLALLAVLALAALALGRGPGTGPDGRWLAVCLLVMFAVQVYVAGAVESWTVAGAFGQRRFVAVTAILACGVAALIMLAHTATARRLAMAALLLCVWWNLGLIVQFGTGLMDRQRLEPSKNAYVSFVVLPARMPALAYQYLFDRETFYRPPR